MQKVKLHRAIIMVAAIGLASVSMTIDAFAIGGGKGGGHAAGRAAPSSGIASGHVSSAPRGVSAGVASQAHTRDGSFMTRIGHGLAPE
jgi:hypothetical protein